VPLPVGGLRQQHVAELEASSSGHSKLARFLLCLFFAGEMSLPTLVTIAGLVYDEEPKHPDILKLSLLGGHGANPNVSKRDLFRRMVRFPIEAAAMAFRLPVKLAGRVSEVDFEMVYPHALFSALFHHYPREFARRFFDSDPTNISRYWHAQEDHPGYNGHAMHEHPSYNFKTSGCPLFVHGDDVASIGIGKVWARAADCLSWGGLLGAAGTATSCHLLVWIIFIGTLTTAADGARTLQVLWKHFVYSMYWLYRGQWPDRDVHGTVYTEGIHFERALQPLAGGFFGILWNLRFDLDWGQWQFQLADPLHGLPCACCSGGKRAKPWTDCRHPESEWIGSTWDRESHRLHFGDNLHRLFRVLPGFCISHYVPDILHCKWLGADQYYLGSALALLTHHWLPGNPQDNLAVVMASIILAYAIEDVPTKHRYPLLRVTMYKGGKAAHIPKLKGTGMQCRALTKVMPRVFEEHMNQDDPVHHRVLIGLKTIRDIDSIYDANRKEYRVPAEASRQLVQLSFLVAQVVTSLIKRFHPQRIPLFHYTIKQHYCLHISLVSAYTNPLVGDCSSGEDFMKAAKKLIKGSVYGNHPAKIGNVCIQKYLKGLHLRFDAESQWWL
jgi:hypothetical protein